MALQAAGIYGPGAAGRFPAGGSARQSPSGTSFEDALGRAQEEVRLSRHAQKRIDRRELGLDSARMDRLSTAIDRAAEKGARNSVVMLDGLAVVVDVRERTIVTALDTGGGGQRVFTNVDSVVVG
ncbi:MAG: flagellar protein [Dehalococcoidia bacterium]